MDSYTVAIRTYTVDIMDEKTYILEPADVAGLAWWSS